MPTHSCMFEHLFESFHFRSKFPDDLCVRILVDHSVVDNLQKVEKLEKLGRLKQVFCQPTFIKTSTNLYYISTWKVSAIWGCFYLKVVLTCFRLFPIKLTSVINSIRKRSRLLPVWLDRHISKSIKSPRSCRRQEKSSPPSPFDCCHPNCPVETKVSSINYLEKKLLLDYKQLILIQTFNTRPKDTRACLNIARWKDINTC